MNKATLCGIGAIVFWSVTALMIVNTGHVPPLLLGAIVFAIGSFACLAIEFKRSGDILSLFRLPASVYIFGTTGIGVYSLLLFAAFKLAPPFAANALNYLWPIFLAVFLMIAQKRRMTLIEITGFLLGFIGTLILFSQKNDPDVFSGSGIEIIGCILALLAAIVWAGYSVLAKNIVYPSAATGVFFLFTALLAGIAHVLLEDTVWPQREEWIFVLLLGVGRISYTLWDHAMKQGDQKLLSSLSYFIPLLSMASLVAYGLLPANSMMVIGGFMIIAGCLCIHAVIFFYPRKSA